MSAYPEEFRRGATEAARAAREGGRPVAHVAKELGVDVKALRRWVVLAEAGQGRNPGPGSAGRQDCVDAEERAELVRLRRENRVLAMGVEILERASAIFARESLPAPKWCSGWSVS